MKSFLLPSAHTEQYTFPWRKDVPLDLSLHTLKLDHMVPLVSKAIQFFEETPVREMPPERFVGTGVYALYYLGGFDPYARLAAVNREYCRYPIYVGKAEPKGRRTGRATTSNRPVLCGRLREHARSIEATTNLRIEDFRCRFMILSGPEADLIVPVESELFRTYNPIWNSCMSGFGIHVPGRGRGGQQPSEWDTLHPGRKFAAVLTGQSRSVEIIEAKVRNCLDRLP